MNINIYIYISLILPIFELAGPVLTRLSPVIADDTRHNLKFTEFLKFYAVMRSRGQQQLQNKKS